MALQSGGMKANSTFSSSRWAGVVLVYLFIPLILLACGGDLRWWQAWAYSILVFTAGVGGRILAERRHPGLLAERLNVGKGTGVKAWDRVLSPLMSISVGFPMVIVGGLDHRYGWSAAFPAWLNILGLSLCAAGYALAVWALMENRFFSGMVRIQTDRGHVVCDSGPYRLLRHPGYAGNILSLPGLALATGSAWALIPAAAALIIAIVRTALEDRTLQEELPGYREYTQRVRYRLFPGIY
jgi:protein-S-isoprenylcysteine O-methyltransferase Ste14